MKRRVLVTGCTGQDGSYLMELLLEKDYEVFGLIRRSSSANQRWRIQHLLGSIELIPGDISDESSIRKALVQSKPQEVYHLAAQSHVPTSYLEPVHTIDITGIGAVRLFETVRLTFTTAEMPRLYQASSSEMFGLNGQTRQNEDSPFHPTSPYGCAKVLAHLAAQAYRESYNLFLVSGIAFNHESPRRGEEFVTRKITKAIGQIKQGKQDSLHLGNLSAARDWTHAKDIVRGMWLSLQASQPQDYVFASGEIHSVREFAEKAFLMAGLSTSSYLRVNELLFRPRDIYMLQGDASKAKSMLNWTPAVTFDELVQEMVEADCAALPRDPVWSA